MTKCPGKTLIKVVGIIMIVFSALSILIGILTLVGGGLGLAALGSDDQASQQALLDGIAAIGEETVGADMDSDVVTGGVIVLLVLGILLILSAVWQLIVGILGVKHCAKPEKARMLFVIGLIALVLSVVGVIGSEDWISYVSMLLPILYSIGAYMNLRARREQPDAA